MKDMAGLQIEKRVSRARPIGHQAMKPRIITGRRQPAKGWPPGQEAWRAARRARRASFRATRSVPGGAEQAGKVADMLAPM